MLRSRRDIVIKVYVLHLHITFTLKNHVLMVAAQQES